MKMMKLAALAAVLLLVGALPAAASDGAAYVLSGSGIAAGLGMGLTIIGAGIGFGRIGGSAMEGMSRQPEVAPRIQTGMIVVAAMLEGATLAAVVLSFLVANKASF
jgi:F-type H+-transporting ATPase subunit c